MKKLLFAAMMLAFSVTFQSAKAEIIMPCNGAFYTDNIRLSDNDILDGGDPYFKVPFKAWFDFPASCCHLRITMPSSLELVKYVDDWKFCEPGEDFIMRWVDDYGNQWEKGCSLFWNKHEENYIKNGEEFDIYDVFIYSQGKKGTLWEPVSYLIPNTHYKMFTLFFGPSHFDELPIGKIGDIEITSYMVNYSNVSPGDPISYLDEDGWPHYTHTWTVDDGYSSYCGDANGDDYINIADVNTVMYLISEPGYHSSCYGDVNQDGNVDIIDLEMVIELILDDAYYSAGWHYYQGHKIEEGHCVASVRYRPNWYDVDGDGNVGVADATDLIDSLLDGNTNDQHDVDGDGRVTIADVVSLIDYILTGQP